MQYFSLIDWGRKGGREGGRERERDDNNQKKTSTGGTCIHQLATFLISVYDEDSVNFRHIIYSAICNKLVRKIRRKVKRK